MFSAANAVYQIYNEGSGLLVRSKYFRRNQNNRTIKASSVGEEIFVEANEILKRNGTLSKDSDTLLNEIEIEFFVNIHDKVYDNVQLGTNFCLINPPNDQDYTIKEIQPYSDSDDSDGDYSFNLYAIGEMVVGDNWSEKLQKMERVLTVLQLIKQKEFKQQKDLDILSIVRLLFLAQSTNDQSTIVDEISSFIKSNRTRFPLVSRLFIASRLYHFNVNELDEPEVSVDFSISGDLIYVERLKQEKLVTQKRQVELEIALVSANGAKFEHFQTLIQFYRESLEKDPNDSTIQENIKSLMSKIEGTSNN